MARGRAIVSFQPLCATRYNSPHTAHTFACACARAPHAPSLMTATAPLREQAARAAGSCWLSYESRETVAALAHCAPHR